MGMLRTITLFICSILLFLGTFSLLFFGTAYFSVIDKGTYNQMIDKGMLDDAVPAMLASGMERGTDAGQKTLMEALNESLTKDWIRKESKNAIGGTLAYLKSENSKFDVRIDLREVKPKLSEALVKYGVRNYGSELQKMAQNALSNETAILNGTANTNISAGLLEEAMQKCKGSSSDGKCEIANDTGQDVLATKQWVEEKLAEFLTKVPDEIDVNELFFQGKAEEKLEPARQNISAVSTAIYVLIALQAVLLGIIYWLSKSAASSLRWAGVAILLGALMSLLAVYLANGYVSSQVAQMGQTGEINGTAATMQSASGFMVSLILGISTKVLSDVQMWSIGILVLGVIMVALSFVMKRNEMPDAKKEGNKQKR